MSASGLYEKVLAGLGEGAGLPPPRPPRASASVVLWRRAGGGELEVYWVHRAEELAFMGGWHAFPGGGVARSDAALALASAPRGVDEGPADAGVPEFVSRDVEAAPLLSPGLVAGALRELFEETGLLPADGGRVPDAERLERARGDLLAGRRGFAEIVDALGVVPDAGRLVYAGRWLTPPLGPLRFDNRFFLLEWPRGEERQPSFDPGELQGGEWLRPAAAVARWQAGEAIVAPPILHILRVLAEEGPEAGLPRLRNPVEANLGPFRRIEFKPGVLLFPLATPTLPPATHTNCYVLGEEESVVIDPGSPFEREIDGLAVALERLVEQGRRLRAIWLTHHHPDHVGGVERLRRRLALPVLAHAATAERLRGVGIAVDATLEDGIRVELEPAFPVGVHWTPGHARGHLCFLEERLRSLVAGDVVAGLGTIVIDPPEGDMEQYLATLERLRRLAPSTLFPAHGPTVRQAVAKLEEYLEHRRWREERILDAWRGGSRTPAELVVAAYDDVPEIARPLAERQIVAHLARLEAHGRLTSKS